VLRVAPLAEAWLLPYPEQARLDLCLKAQRLMTSPPMAIYRQESARSCTVAEDSGPGEYRAT
jgi:hypothetical protein